jgi:hypothetical protein
MTQQMKCLGPAGRFRTKRGGDHRGHPEYLIITLRHRMFDEVNGPRYGFRVARSR